MYPETGAGWRHRSDSGATLYLVALAMVVVLGISGLAIDLVSLYLARNEAQRAADAAALAGAYLFLSQGCTTGVGGCVAGGPQEAPATTQATQVAAQNLVGGQAPSSSTVNVSFSYPNVEEPQITVSVYRDSTHSNPMPTFFAKIFGVATANLSASATAEAFNPSGSNVDVGESCIRPFFVPNCDDGHPAEWDGTYQSPVANTNCGGTGPNALGQPTGYTVPCPPGVAGTCYPSYYFDPNSSPKGKVVNPGTCNWQWTTPAPPAGTPPGRCTSGGVVGEFWGLHTDAGPSQWYLVGYTGNSANALRTFIETCIPKTYACGSPLNTANGKKVGPVDQGVNALINASGDGPDQGQDVICSTSTNNPAFQPTNAVGGRDFGGTTCSSSYGASGPPFRITGGSNNPNPSLRGQTFYGGSSSIVSVVVYDGHQLPSGGGTATVIGFMQGFLVAACHGCAPYSGTDDEIDMVIINAGGCGTSAGDGSTTITSTGGTPIPIRLIHQ
jgi:hypothetical protein